MGSHMCDYFNICQTEHSLPFTVICNHLSFGGWVAGGQSQSQLTWPSGGVHPEQVVSSLLGWHVKTKQFTLTLQLQTMRRLQLTVISLEGGEKLENPEKKRADTGTRVGFKPRTLML